MSTIKSSENDTEAPATAVDNITLKKYPFLGTSPNLFDAFYLIGYDQYDIHNDFIKNIEEIVVSNNKVQNKDPSPVTHYFSIYTPKDNPLMLNTISNMKERIPLLREEEIIKLTFPEVPPIYYYIFDQNDPKTYDPNEYNVIFFVNNDDLHGKVKMTKSGFSYVFYETKDKKIVSNRKGSLPNDNNKAGGGINNEDSSTKTIKIFIPKAFCFMSEYPFFTQYSKIANKLYSICKSDKIKIPIEIIIFNLINFIPSPLKSPIILSADFDQIKKDGDPKTDIILHQLSGYPLFDFNFAEIFSILPITTIAQIAICNILEINMLFFSKNIEVLNIIMYIIASLSFPCCDSEYQWFILSVSREDLEKNQDHSLYIDRPGSSMLGINCSYSKDIKVDNFNYPILIADLDNKAIEVKVNPDDCDDENMNENLKIWNLIQYFDKIMINKNSDSNNLIEKALISLTLELESKAKKVIHLNTNQNSQIVPKFLTWDNTIHMTNKALIELFYEFNLNIFQMLYQHVNIQFGKTGSKKKKDKTQNEFSIEFSLDYTELSPEHRTLFELFNNSTKVNCLILSFIQNSYCSKDMLKIPLIFSEEFIQIKKANKILYEKEQQAKESQKQMNSSILSTSQGPIQSSIQQIAPSQDAIILIPEIIKLPYFDLIDKFYAINQKNNKGDLNFSFQAFIKIYNKEMKDEYVNCLKESKSITVKEVTSLKQSYYYKWIELDKNILFKYMYFINNLEEKKLEELFPFIQIIEKNKKVELIQISLIPHIIEQSLIQNKIITINDLINTDLILFFAMTIGQNYIRSLKEFGILSVIENIRYCKRRYIYVLIDLYLKMWNDKKHKSILGYLYELTAFLQEFNLIPTKQIMEQLELYCIAKKENEMNGNNTLGNESEPEKVFTAADEKDKYKMYLKKNSCRDGVIKEDKLMNEVNNNIYDGDIELICPKCGNEIKPLYFFQDNISTIESRIYAPHKILTKMIAIFKPKYRQELSLKLLVKDDYKTLYEIALSLLFYLKGPSIAMPNEEKEALEYLMSIYLKKYYLAYTSMK